MPQVHKSVDWVDARSVPFEAVHLHPPDAFQRLLLEHATPRTVAVDAACGTGRVALPLAARVRAVTAVDRDEELVRAAAREAARHRVRNATFYAADIEEEPWSEWLPDGVGVCAMHLFASRKAFERAAEALPDGCALVVAAFGEEQWRELGERHRLAWTPGDLIEALERAGFRVDEAAAQLRVANAPTFDVLENQYFRHAHALRERWRENGRWDALRESFRRGERTLTESRVVVRATR